jgi:hypothetical protein
MHSRVWERHNLALDDVGANARQGLDGHSSRLIEYTTTDSPKKLSLRSGLIPRRSATRVERRLSGRIIAVRCGKRRLWKPHST